MVAVLIDGPRRFVAQQSGLVDLVAGQRNLLLDHTLVGQRLTECDAVVDAVDHQGHGSLGHADGAHAVVDAARPEPAFAGPVEITEAGPVERVAVTHLRKVIAQAMALSAHTSAHVTHVEEADVTDLVAAYHRMKARIEKLRADGRAALEMILAIYESHRHNAPVPLPLALLAPVGRVPSAPLQSHSGQASSTRRAGGALQASFRKCRCRSRARSARNPGSRSSEWRRSGRCRPGQD